MTYQPVVIGSGLAGWRFLKSTQPQQMAVFQEAKAVERATDTFEARIGQIDSARELVSDRQLLEVALTAFGLGDDLNNSYFIQRILEEGTLNEDALATRMADDRYVSLSKAFGFGDFSVPRTKLSDFSSEIKIKYIAQKFEEAIGAQREDIRLALNFERAFSEVARTGSSQDAKWFRIMGNPPLRSVLEKALGLPNSVGKLDIDQQLVRFKELSRERFGTSDPALLSELAVQNDIIDTFLLRTQVDEINQANENSAALAMMQTAVAFQKSLAPQL